MSLKDKKEKSNKVEKIIRFSIVGLIVLLVVSFGLYMILKNSTTYIAQVGDEKISEEEYRLYLDQVKYNMLMSVGTEVDPNTFWDTKIDNKPAIEIAKEQALEVIRQQKVQLIKAKEFGMKLSEEEKKAVGDNLESGLIQQYGTMSAARGAFKQQTGMTIDQFKKFMMDDVLIQKYQSEKVNEIEVTDEVFLDYYNKNADQFKTSRMRPYGEEAVWVKHILIPTLNLETNEELTEEEQETARQKAEEILQKAKNGEDFASLAKEHSQDGNASQGGDYVFVRQVMDPAFEESAFGMELSEISDLVKTPFGYHIIKLEEKYSEGQPVSLECAKEYYEYGEYFIINNIFLEMLEEWTKDYKIEIFESAYDKIV